MNRFILKLIKLTKNYLISKLANNKYLLQDKHTFKPLLIEIEDRPVNPVGHFILWAVVSVFFISIIWLSVSEIDVVVTARGKLVPTGDVKTIQSAYKGIIKKILVKEGDIVNKGDLLIEVDTNIIDIQLSTKKEELDNLNIKIKRLISLIDNLPFDYNSSMNKEQYLNEKAIFNNEINSYNKKSLVLDERIAETNQKIEISLLDKQSKKTNLNLEEEKLRKLKNVLDIIPKIQYTTNQYKVKSLKSEIKSFENKLNVYKNNLEVLSYQKKLLKDTDSSKYYKEFADSRIIKNKLISEIDTLKLQKDKHNIISPVDGYVLKLNVNTLDGVINPAEKLLTVVPYDVKIIANVDVSNKDIGFIFNGMDCLLKIDTFDFQRYGFINAKVKNISTTSVERKQVGLVYEVLLELEKDFLLLNNNKRILKPGMTITAELKVGKRKLIEFFIYPAIKHFREGTSII